jgi:hypothetical protein
VFQPALVLQKRGRLGEKDAKGTQSGIFDVVPRVGTRFALVRQLTELTLQDVFAAVKA